MVLRKIDNNACLFMILPPKKCTFTPIYRKISAGGRQAVFGWSSSKEMLTILLTPISFISPLFWEKLTMMCLFMIFFRQKNAPLHQFIVKSLRGGGGGRQTVIGSSSSKVILTILSRPISFMSPWFWEKLTIMCLFMIFFDEKMHFYTNLS